jgi:TRAP-type C4-dicarboxylate transport system permease small subunit
MERIVRLAERAGTVLSAVSCALLLAITILDVAGRPLQVSMSLLIEVGGILAAALIFLALADITATNEHIRADFFEAYIPARLRPWLQVLFIDLVFLVYGLALMWLCTKLAATYIDDGIRSQTLLRLPVGWPQLVMVAGLGILCLRLILRLFADVRGLLGGQPRPDG